MKKDYVVVKYHDSWSDEFEVDGFAVMSQEEYDSYEKAVHEASYPFNFGFGTNEDILYESPQDFLSKIVVCPITAEDANIIENIFGKYCHFGIFPCIDRFLESVEE